VEVAPRSLPVPPKFASSGQCWIRSQGAGIYFSWKDIGAFLVQDGSSIFYDPLPGVPAGLLRLPILGILLGTLLHQRGLFTLHASAASIGGRTVAFLGEKGAGKSTTVGALQANGYPPVTDDILALSVNRNGSIQARPSLGHLKLWPESARSLGYDVDSLPSINGGTTKRWISPKDSVEASTIPLHCLYILEKGPRFDISPVRGGAAFKAVLSQTYVSRFLGSKASTRSYFEHCHAVVQRVPLFRLQRPDDLSLIERLVSYVEDHCIEQGCVADTGQVR